MSVAALHSERALPGGNVAVAAMGKTVSDGEGQDPEINYKKIKTCKLRPGQEFRAGKKKEKKSNTQSVTN